MNAATPSPGAARTWVDGVEVTCDADAWDRRVASFLGFGFRLVLPGGPVRPRAAAHARAQVTRLAALLDAEVDEQPWPTLLEEERESSGAVEVVGGWEHRFRQPPGACSTRVTELSGPTGAARLPGVRTARGVELPWSVNEHSPTVGLPMVSSHGAARARRTLADGEVGLWRNTAGQLVDTTAGTPLVLTAAGWTTPGKRSGAVWHHVADRVRLGLGAQDRHPTPDEVLAVVCVDPVGSTTRLLDPGQRADDRAADDPAADDQAADAVAELSAQVSKVLRG
ncbi:hypothetical protein [Nocardioides jishulii]|uniref:Uncharacterized protein n=1 Tax=Nocardioides jishulii TaxID=2575440 RepID=A0A4U2YI95_9ACTN|nr:hypothetical protein [Nocardioides jishulii]QCX28123.1 hypothetical protein FCL41_11770 [Nocardioides jishulii]TKI60788.1 hypothetical protein FC770_14845 [Nocardioides jishulii]